jgi:hypothetical protein
MSAYGYKMTDEIYNGYKVFDQNLLAMQTKVQIGLLDENFNVIVSPDYEAMDFVSVGVLKLTSGKKIIYYDLLSNRWIWQ